MDGVLDDFVGGTCKVHNRESPYANGAGRGCFDMEKLWGITPEQFWPPTNSYEFWFELDKTPEADEIVSLVTSTFGEENVCILTSPSDFDGCIRAKRDWIKKFYPIFSKRIIFGAAKEFLAGPDRFLIDDRDRNVEDFTAAGGRGILVPRAWNRLHHLEHHTVTVLREELRGVG